MNREELIGKLQMVYIGDKNALNELIGYYDELKEEIKTKHNGFMASVEESCELAKEVDLWNNKYNFEYNIRIEFGERINKCLELLSHFSGGQVDENTRELAIKIEDILRGGKNE